jgi:hypothetical protein
MSAETDLRALLAGHAGVSALVGSNIAHNAIKAQTPPPYVVFTCAHSPLLTIGAGALADQCLFSIQCWGKTAANAEAVADAVQAALATAPAARGVAITSRASGYDEELGFDATIFSVEWWA